HEHWQSYLQHLRPQAVRRHGGPPVGTTGATQDGSTLTVGWCGMRLEILSFERRGQERYWPRRPRRILCFVPKYSRSLETFHHDYPMISGIRAFILPQGIPTIASHLPRQRNVRFLVLCAKSSLRSGVASTGPKFEV